MSQDTPNLITVELDQNAKITMHSRNTNTSSVYISNYGDSVMLFRANVYFIPIREDWDLMDFVSLRINPIYSHLFILTNVKDHIATIVPLVDSVKISSGEIIGMVV